MQITVGIPFYNSAATLTWAVQSVLAQTFRDFELLLVDDGSTDDSPASLEPFLRDPRVRLVQDGRRLGLAKRLNQMVDLARGTFFARMDADDLMFPERLARQHAALCAAPNIDILATGIVSIDRDNTPLGIREVHAGRISALDVLRRGGFVHPTILGKTDWFRQNRYSSRFPRAEDRELWARTVSRAVFQVLPEPLLFYREIGIGDPGKILIGYASERRIMRLYGKPLLGLLRCADLVARSLVKSLALSGFWGKRVLGFLETSRTLSLSETEHQRFAGIIQATLGKQARLVKQPEPASSVKQADSSDQAGSGKPAGPVKQAGPGMQGEPDNQTIPARPAQPGTSEKLS